jgi:hypothetical protein
MEATPDLYIDVKWGGSVESRPAGSDAYERLTRHWPLLRGDCFQLCEALGEEGF